MKLNRLWSLDIPKSYELHCFCSLKQTQLRSLILYVSSDGLFITSALHRNSFFQNFTLKAGDQDEYVHPYLIKLSLSSLSVSYPSRFYNYSFVYKVFKADLIISESKKANGNLKENHIISSFSVSLLISSLLIFGSFWLEEALYGLFCDN